MGMGRTKTNLFFLEKIPANWSYFTILADNISFKDLTRILYRLVFSVISGLSLNAYLKHVVIFCI